MNFTLGGLEFTKEGSAGFQVRIAPTITTYHDIFRPNHKVTPYFLVLYIVQCVTGPDCSRLSFSEEQVSVTLRMCTISQGYFFMYGILTMIIRV